MICTTIINKNLEQILEILGDCEMAEIRLDTCNLSLDDIDICFSSDIPLIATCRLANPLDDNECSLAQEKLVRAIEAGAKYVDVEIEMPKFFSKRIRQAAHEAGSIFIRSYHDYQGTDSLEALKAIVEKCCNNGADLVKIVTTAKSKADVGNVLSLYEFSVKEGLLKPGELVAFSMGELGQASRIEALKYGAPFTYAASSEADIAAPGQMTTAKLRNLIYGNTKYLSSALKNPTLTLHMPASKSFAQRAILAAALAEGVSKLHNYSPCGDSEAAISLIESLGVKVHRYGSTVEIEGGIKAEDIPPKIFVGESGLLARLMIPVIAQIAKGATEIYGEKTLLQRPMLGVADMMSSIGVTVESIGIQPDFQQNTEAKAVKIPLKIQGHIEGGRMEISAKHTSQLVSGLLMALPLAERNSSLLVTEPKSIPYMFITLDVLKKFGIKASNDILGGKNFHESGGDWAHSTEMVFKLRGGQRYQPTDMELEGDWSAAANFLVAGAIFGKLELEGLDITSLQADLSIVDILIEAGAYLSQFDDKQGTILVQRAPLQAFNINAIHCPDLFPILSVLASFSQGESRIAGVSRLAHKESDRGEGIIKMLNQMGVLARIEGDELVIEGQSLPQRLLNNKLLNGGKYSSYSDHRMVMALKVASLGASSPIIIDDEECVDKSFPGFLEDFEKYRQNLNNKTS